MTSRGFWLTVAAMVLATLVADAIQKRISA